MNLEKLETEVPKLDTRGRARLAEKLLHSLEALSEAENKRLWDQEAQRRHQELEAGTIVGQPAEEVLREARARLG